MVAAATNHVDGVAVLRLRGLPFNATNSDITQFFEGYSVHDILITRTYGEQRRLHGVIFMSKLQAACKKHARLELRSKRSTCRNCLFVVQAKPTDKPMWPSMRHRRPRPSQS